MADKELKDKLFLMLDENAKIHKDSSDIVWWNVSQECVINFNKANNTNFHPFDMVFKWLNSSSENFKFD